MTFSKAALFASVLLALFNVFLGRKPYPPRPHPGLSRR